MTGTNLIVIHSLHVAVVVDDDDGGGGGDAVAANVPFVPLSRDG
jgi:hypothetical protein